MPYITHIGTAVPTNQINQEQAANFFIQACQLEGAAARKARLIYKATRISQRHSILSDYGKLSEFEFYPDNSTLTPFPTTAQRLAVYEKEAVNLGVKAVKDAFSGGTDFSGITHLITFSCTGMYAPGLDIDLINQLGLPQTVQRICINFMGCYAAFSAMKTAEAFCLANPEAKVLAVGVELCTLHFQKDQTDDQLIANAIFADGAAAFLMQNQSTSPRNLETKGFFCDLIPKGSRDMAWHIADFGFEMKLSSYIPDLLGENINQALNQFISLDEERIDHYAVHPGGKRILEQLESALDMRCPISHQILKNHGNMSSVTVLFVLKEILKAKEVNERDEQILAMAFGPGLTLEAGRFVLKTAKTAKV